MKFDLLVCLLAGKIGTQMKHKNDVKVKQDCKVLCKKTPTTPDFFNDMFLLSSQPYLHLRDPQVLTQVPAGVPRQTDVASLVFFSFFQMCLNRGLSQK